MSTFAGYTRVSAIGDRGDRVTSHEQQRAAIAGFARGRFEVEFLPEESDESGNKAERPILGEAISGIEDGRFAGVIVADIDRLSRLDIVEGLKIIQHIERDLGGEVKAVAQNFDTSTPEGKHMRNMWLSQAHCQWELYAQGFARSKQRAVDAGIWPMPIVPMGYACTRRRDGGDGKLHPGAAEARELLERAFQARASGEPWGLVAEILSVGTSTAGKIIRNRVYLGEIHVKGCTPNLAAHSPLVGQDLWEAAQVKHPKPPRGVHPPALLTGRVRCAGCQGAMTPNSSVKKGVVERIYRCSARNKAGGDCTAPAIISQAKLDAYVERLALAEIDHLAISAKQRTSDLDAADKALATAKAELDAFQQMTRVNDIGPESFAAGMKSRMSAVEDASAELARARGLVSAVPQYGTLRALWPKLNVDERRHVLGGSLGAVWVRKGRGPVTDRVRVVAAGFGPGRTNGRHQLAPLVWEADLEGEVRPAGAQHV